jgi:UDP-2,3-diacylglucosamine pyrophosphatase LpxH
LPQVNESQGDASLPRDDQGSAQFFRSIFLSDFHIGAKNFDAQALLDFLKRTESDYLYLVGDIIDGWKLHKRWYWNETINQVFDELFRKAHEGTKIIYITGNHDESVRKFNLITRMRYARRVGIQIKNRIVHKALDGREFLILHGDQFDRKLLRGPLSRISDRIYDALTEVIQKRKPLKIEIDGQMKRFSMAKFLAYHGQLALNILNNFENALCHEAKRSDVDGIICGHTHIPALKKIRGITYANCGSWLTSKPTAIVEKENGQIDLLDWRPLHLPMISNVTNRYRPMTLRLVQSIRKAWPSPHDASHPEIISKPQTEQIYI